MQPVPESSPQQLPPAGVMHLWRFSLETDQTTHSRDWIVLNDEERTRAGRMRHLPSRFRFVAARAHLRETLARYTGQSPAAVQFIYGEHGKPFLPSKENQIAPDFNLTHAGECALLAITTGARVGVDLEDASRPIRIMSIARRFFTSHEIERLENIHEQALRQRHFFEIWTAKEAALKALGGGITLGLDSVSISGEELLGMGNPKGGQWCLMALPCPAPWIANLCIEGPAPRIIECPAQQD